MSRAMKMAPTDDDICGETSEGDDGGYICNRWRGHGGLHEAYGDSEQPLITWGVENPEDPTGGWRLVGDVIPVIVSVMADNMDLRSSAPDERSALAALIADRLRLNGMLA